MKLWLKFNLAFLLAFVVGLTAIGLVSYRMLQQNAREEVLHTAGLIMQQALAVRGYTIDQIQPLLQPVMLKRFLPQSVPAYAAKTDVARLRKKYPEYTYREATLNPTNPIDRATDWESGIVEDFRNHPRIKQLVGVHNTATGKKLYVARPLRVRNKACMECHGNVSDAPATMLALYGKSNGFGWKMNEVVGAQIVNVPMELALSRARKTLVTFLTATGVVLLLIIALLNALLYRIVIRPIRTMSSIAHEVSMGKLDIAEYQLDGKDEIASLSRSFNRMRRSLVSAMNMIED